MSKMVKRQVSIPAKLDQIILDIGAQIDNDFDEEVSKSVAYRKVLIWAVQKWKLEASDE